MRVCKCFLDASQAWSVGFSNLARLILAVEVTGQGLCSPGDQKNVQRQCAECKRHNPVLCFFHHRKTVWSHLESTRTSHKIFSPHWSGPLGCIVQRAVKKALPPLYMWLCTVYRIPRRYTLVALMLFVVEDSRISRASWSRQAVQSFSKAASSRAVV